MIKNICALIYLLILIFLAEFMIMHDIGDGRVKGILTHKMPIDIIKQRMEKHGTLTAYRTENGRWVFLRNGKVYEL